MYFNWKEALLIKREENVLFLRRLCTCFQKRRKCTKFEKLMYTFLIKKKNLRRREEFKKKMYIPLKMALKYIVDVKARHFYNHKDPPFDIKHQLMSVDPVPVLKIDLK